MGMSMSPGARPRGSRLVVEVVVDGVAGLEVEFVHLQPETALDVDLVERDHRTKKDTFYLYKAEWNSTDMFVHICGKEYTKTTGRVIKCYTNDGSSLDLYVNNTKVETVTVTDHIAEFTAANYSSGDVIRVEGSTTNDTLTFS